MFWPSETSEIQYLSALRYFKDATTSFSMSPITGCSVQRRYVRGWIVRRLGGAFEPMIAVKGNNSQTKDVQIVRFFRVYIILVKQWCVESLARAHKGSQCHWLLSECCQIWTVNSFWQAESNYIKRRARKCVVFQQANWHLAWRPKWFYAARFHPSTLQFRVPNFMQILTAE